MKLKWRRAFIIVLPILFLLISPLHVIADCATYFDDIVSHCESLSNLCLGSKGANISAEGEQKGSMAHFYRNNRDELLQEMIEVGVDCSKRHEVKIFMIRKYFEYSV